MKTVHYPQFTQNFIVVQNIAKPITIFWTTTIKALEVALIIAKVNGSKMSSIHKLREQLLICKGRI